jgi:uncharacterized protein YdhG (YjbR/CyaY superfamily)
VATSKGRSKKGPTDTERVQAYLKTAAPKARAALRKIRTIVRASAAGVTDGFSYRIPQAKLGGKPLVWYAAFTHHVSLFPMTAAIRKANATALKGYKTSTGTVQFPLDRPLPLALIKRLVKARVAEAQKQGRRK